MTDTKTTPPTADELAAQVKAERAEKLTATYKYELNYIYDQLKKAQDMQKSADEEIVRMTKALENLNNLYESGDLKEMPTGTDMDNQRGLVSGYRLQCMKGISPDYYGY